MKRNEHLGLIVAGLLVLGAAGPVGASFVNEFAPANWELNPSTSNPGTYVFTGAGNAEVFNITGSTTAGASDTIISTKSPYSGYPSLVSFTWSLADNGNQGSALAYYMVGTEIHPLIGTGGTLYNISVPANALFGFELTSSVIGGKTPAALQISAWEGVMVPEAGTWLAGLLAVGVFTFEILRRKLGAPSDPAQK